MQRPMQRPLMGYAKSFLVAIAILCGAATAAHATNVYGWACNIELQPSSSMPSLGNAGFVTFALYPGPHCTGTVIGNYTVCSTGATASTCVNQLYDEPQLNAVFTALVSSTIGPRQLLVATDTSGNLQQVSVH